MKCPYCQCEMEQGYIQNRDGLAWTKKEHFVLIISHFRRLLLFFLSTDILIVSSVKRKSYNPIKI